MISPILQTNDLIEDFHDIGSNDRNPTELLYEAANIIMFVSSVRSSNSHPDLLLTHQQHPLFQITPVLNTGLSLSEPLQLYKGYNAIYKGNHWTQYAGFMDASWVPLGITDDDLGTSWALPGGNLGMTWG